MKVTVSKKMEAFDAAHFLPRYEGKCNQLHGHHWDVEVGVAGILGPETGMVVDFGLLKKAYKPLHEMFDHHLVNDIVENPTAENIAIYIFNWLNENFINYAKYHMKYGDVLELSFVRVWETPDSMAEVRA